MARPGVSLLHDLAWPGMAGGGGQWRMMIFATSACVVNGWRHHQLDGVPVAGTTTPSSVALVAVRPPLCHLALLIFGLTMDAEVWVGSTSTEVHLAGSENEHRFHLVTALPLQWWRRDMQHVLGQLSQESQLLLQHNCTSTI